MKIGIVGAGSIGGWIGARLAASGNTVSVLARGETLSAISKEGIVLRTATGESAHRVVASDDAAKLGVQDVVIVAVKAQSVPMVADAIARMTGPETIVIPMLNGVPWWFMGEGRPLAAVDPDGRIAATVPHGQILGCVVHASSSSPEPGVIQLKFADKLILGEASGGDSARVTSLVELFEGAGVPCVASANIRQDIWYKLWGNMTMNPISAITLATADRILDDSLVNAFVLKVMDEAKAIGAEIGCPINQSGEDRNAVTRKLGAFKTSMLQDTEAGRGIELDALLAAPREIAGKLGIATPAIDALFGIARLMGQSRGIY